jgi:hypothetical protein
VPRTPRLVLQQFNETKCMIHSVQYTYILNPGGDGIGTPGMGGKGTLPSRCGAATAESRPERRVRVERRELNILGCFPRDVSPVALVLQA